ncbi:uncharacterized protein isoform X2 [Rhodnius prolixus]
MESEGCEEAYTPIEESEPPGPKKKRKTEVFQQLPSTSTVGFSPETVEELQAAYEILQSVMKINKIDAFLVKPCADLYGMSDYYKIIKNPMWLNEVHRKLMDREYHGIKEVVADIKLVLENCYRFWGLSHRVTKKGLHIEHKLEQKLEALPMVLKSKCLEIENPGEIVFKTENSEECLETEELQNDGVDDLDEECNFYSTYKGFHSKILSKVLKIEQNEFCSEENLEEQKKKEQEMLAWEKEYLVDEKSKFEITHTYQLAQIGQFLRLTSSVLNVEEITQYEVERMLLMPRESTTLATLMTSMLSPAVLRSNLDVTPIMPYEVWTSKLKKKIEDWLKVYYTTDAVSAFNINGIEPYFWDVISLVNPLEEKRFHEIPFYERIWILKSLCDNLQHTNKTVQDVFVDETRASEFRAIDFGAGPIRTHYFGLEFFPELRVYKQSGVVNRVWNGWNKAEVGILKLLRTNLTGQWNQAENKIEFLPSASYFSIVADSVDSLTAVIENLKTKGFNKLTKKLNVYLSDAKKHKFRLEGLEALYRQWHDYQNRAPEYFTNILNLWLSNEGPVYPKKGEEEFPVLGKRRTATKTSIFFTGRIESSEESDEEEFVESEVSDWEEASKRIKRRKNPKNKRRRRSKSSVADELRIEIDDNAKKKMEASTVLGTSNDNKEINEGTNNIASLQSSKSTIVTNNVDHTKQAVITNSKTTISRKSSIDVPTITQQPVHEVKKEPEDIITISSDEEDVIMTVTKPTPPPQTVAPSAVPPPPPRPVNEPPPPPVTSVKPPLTSGTMIGSSVVLFKVTPSTSPPIKMPQPIIETVPAVVMPKPIQEVVTTPRKKPVPRPIQEPPPPPSPKHASPHRTPPRQGWAQGTPSPRNRSPLAITPRPRMPMNPRMMSSPSVGGMVGPVNSMRGNTTMVQRNLFPSNQSTVPSIEGTLHIGPKEDGSYGYHVRLPDGGIINMSREDIEIIRQKNNGNLPNIVKVPLVRSNNRMF